jgi:hypothetical protein
MSLTTDSDRRDEYTNTSWTAGDEIYVRGAWRGVLRMLRSPFETYGVIPAAVQVERQ